MRIGILGSGLMGGKLGTLFARAGHDVVFSYARSDQKLKRLARGAQGNARAGTPGEAAREADALLLAVHWSRVDDVLKQAGDVSGNVIVSCSLPMNADNTDLVIAHTSSGAEALAQMVPAGRVVSAFNTVPSEVLPGVFEARRKTGTPSRSRCSSPSSRTRVTEVRSLRTASSGSGESDSGDKTVTRVLLFPPMRRSPSPRATPPSGEHERLVVAGREVAISNPQKALFPKPKHTKLDLVRYYLAVAEGALRGAGHRPNVLVRYPNGIKGEFFCQKRAPESRPPWVEVVTLRFPSGRTAEEVVPRDAAALAWMANLACLELHPHPVTTDDLDHPNELRVDLDPVPGIKWPQVRQVARVVQETLADCGLVGWPKTSGSRGMHVIVRIERRWEFDAVRRAALALAREVERRAPKLATSKWWKAERHGVFIDYNQNAKDRTVASAYSVRPTPDARVSAPLDWDEVDDCDPADFTLATMPRRFGAIGDRHARIDEQARSLDALLELSLRDERAGLGDAAWPPHFRKQPGEPTRVQPSKARAPRHPLIEIGRSRVKKTALEGLKRWKQRHAKVAAYLKPEDVLVDSMRGRFTTWTRVRVNLRNVPATLRPRQGRLDPDDKTLSAWA